MNVTDCPTPNKRKYPTRAAADAGSAVQSTRLAPYQCQCSSWHLTTRHTVAPVANDALVKQLATLPDTQFSVHVAAELRGHATPEIAAALRHKANWGRWRVALRAEQTAIQVELAAKKGMDDPQTKRWRAALVKRGGFIQARQLEIEALKDERKRELEALKPTKEEKLRSQASNAAKRRLIAAHWDEFQKYLVEELAARGLELDSPQAKQT